METLTEEATQAEVTTRTFTLEQDFRGSLILELVKSELDAMVALQDES